MKNKELPAMPIRLRKDWSKAKIGHCECGHHGSIVDGLCADCHDVEYQQEREQVLIDRIIELQSQDKGLTKREMFAKEALQGLLANKYTGDPANWDSPQEWVKQISEAAVEFADATLDELERTGSEDMMLEGEQ